MGSANEAVRQALAAEVQNYERLEECFALAKELAEKRGWPLNWRLVEAEGVAHDHEKMFNHPKCAEALFGTERERGREP